MDFRQLEAFVAVVELASFSKAGERLFLTQPTISAHINSLEKELEQPLIIRNNKLVYANEAGRRLFDYAVRILHLREEALCSLRQTEMDTGNIDIAASAIPAKYLLPKIISCFHQKHPNISFTISRSEPEVVCQKLLSDEVNLGFSGTLIDSVHCYNYPVSLDELVVVTPNNEYYRELGRDGFSLESIYREPFLSRQRGSDSRNDLENYLPKIPDWHRLNIVAEIGDTEMLLRAVEEGMGISAVSKYAAEDFSRFGRVLKFPLEGQGVVRKLYMVRRKKAVLSQIERAFIDYVLEYVENMV
ncbi:MAG: selenium metabolism-associated LysR family transcriptional regulator [Bacillota bacterium]|nr:selenium metabolism-associated LysR family transcriptional regulator [Bacillota bacterium]